MTGSCSWLQAGGNPYAVLWAWAACQAAHVGFRCVQLPKSKPTPEHWCQPTCSVLLLVSDRQPCWCPNVITIITQHKGGVHKLRTLHHADVNDCRYAALASLRLTSLNHKRACFLVSAHAAGRPVPGLFLSALVHTTA